MAFSRLVFPLLVLSIVNCYASKVPVYMWGDLPERLSKTSPLSTLNENEFSDILQEELVNRLVVVFAEETLSVEDFSRRNADGETSFQYLHSKVGAAEYLPSVVNPLHVLQKYADGSETVIDLNKIVTSEEVSIKSADKFVFINLKDALEDESRVDYLRRHDEFMRETISKIQENRKNVIAIYTARFPSWIISDVPVTHSRTRRAVGRTDYTNLNGVRLYAKSISMTNRNESIPLSGVINTSSNINDTVLNATLIYENETSITLNFDKRSGYWFFESVTLVQTPAGVSQVLQPVEEVYALEGFSYRCGQNVTFTSDLYTINFGDLKVQPFFMDTNASTEFGDSFNCVGFFSAPIWAGLFVTFIMLTITFYGIMMMMDIRTMDRFDDPKGKTITINTSE